MQRVAAYCRVSTDREDQANSLESQERYFREYIRNNPAWELAQIFVDQGITGTSTKRREAFQNMMAEAMQGKFDLILTKEISRFARNTLDSIYYTRQLKEKGIGVVFMNDNINTMDPDAELRLTILSSIAQEESRKTSERVKWGQKRSMEQGVVFGRDLLGYDVRDGMLFVNPEGAKTVRLIFQKFVQEGKGSCTIARELQEAGIPTSTYMKKWSHTVILRILRNEKMAGDLVQKKTYTPNYLTHEKKYNRGEEEWVILKNHHEPIVSRELFECAQKELKKRALSESYGKRHSVCRCLSGKIQCASCGSSFVIRSKRRKDGSVCSTWRCCRAVRYGKAEPHSDSREKGCCCPSVNEETLKELLLQIMQSLEINREELLCRLCRVLNDVTAGEDETQKSLEEKTQILEKKQSRLLELFLEEDIAKADFQKKQKQYKEEAIRLLREKEKREREGPKEQIREEITNLIKELIYGKRWENCFYRNVIDHIIVEENHTILISLQKCQARWLAVYKKGSNLK